MSLINFEIDETWLKRTVQHMYLKIIKGPKDHLEVNTLNSNKHKYKVLRGSGAFVFSALSRVMCFSRMFGYTEQWVFTVGNYTPPSQTWQYLEILFCVTPGNSYFAAYG